MKESSLRIICDRNFKTKALFSDLTTKNGNKALFILRNRAHSFVAENWAYIFVIKREEKALSSRYLYT